MDLHEAFGIFFWLSWILPLGRLGEEMLRLFYIIIYVYNRFNLLGLLHTRLSILVDQTHTHTQKKKKKQHESRWKTTSKNHPKTPTQQTTQPTKQPTFQLLVLYRAISHPPPQEKKIQESKAPKRPSDWAQCLAGAPLQSTCGSGWCQPCLSDTKSSEWGSYGRNENI